MYTYLILILIGLVAGFISGLIGMGGGVFIVPALVMLLGYSQKAAQGTSLGILLLPVGILAVYKYYQHGYVNPGSVLVMAGAFFVGGFIRESTRHELERPAGKKSLCYYSADYFPENAGFG